MDQSPERRQDARQQRQSGQHTEDGRSDSRSVGTESAWTPDVLDEIFGPPIRIPRTSRFRCHGTTLAAHHRLTPASHTIRRVSDIPIRDEAIRLGQFLKLANLIDSGADAKSVIADGLVQVNGEVETRRGRRLVAGDTVEFEGVTARVATGVPD